MYKNFAERFKEQRLKKDLTQQELADKFHIARGNISKYENGTQIPEYSLLTKFCNFFGVTRSYMLDEFTSVGEVIEAEIKKENLLDVRQLTDVQKKEIAKQVVDIMKILNKK